MCQRTLFGIILSLLCLYSLADKNASSLLWLDPPRIVASYGSSISANCSTNSKYMQLEWEISLGDMMTQNKTVTWIVKNLTEWDMEPSCFINTDTSHQYQIPLSLTVYKTPDSVSIRTVGDTGPMFEKHQYALQCDIQNVAPVRNVTVKWYKGETLVGNTTFNNSTKCPENLFATLQIFPSRTDDGAQYRCEAQLDLGPEGPQPPPTVMSDPLNITVYYGPEISCPGNITVKHDEEFTPSCTAQGHPTPTMTWYKEGAIVVFPQIMQINDAGQYIFYASSNHTSVSQTVEIEVLYAPFAIKELKNIVIDQGYNGELKCSSVSKPRPKYKWTYPPEANVRVTNIDGVSLLFIDYATVNDTGNYTCIAYNHLGKTSTSVRVDIGETQTCSASISTVNHSGPMIEGDRYDLRCDVQYVAPVQNITINWYKGTTAVKSKSMRFPELPQPNEKTKEALFDTLQVSSNRSDNGAQYKCEAEVIPKAGSTVRITSDPLSITVHYKPVINTSKLPSVVPVFRGYPEVLVCEAEGYPQPTVRWTFKSILFTGGNYTIEEATNENVGLYNCTASNSVDTTVRVVKVILKEDYLPLIAGFVALVVVIISVFFIIIYSIYYKNTKMGRYMVEGAKPNAQNGNVAQNGKDSAIPMKKLSQNSISV